ncbi:MAG: NAD(+)--rifampin ADP-ribosyltransferase, partial [Flavisolibacter sp.]
MEFSPKNNVVKLCLQGMNLEENGRQEQAKNIFLRAWDEAASGFEKFIAAHFVARHQKNISDQLTWLQTQLNLALQVNDDAVKPAFALLYSKIGECYKELKDTENAEKYFTLANSCTQTPADKGPFYHGTKAHLK